MHIHEYQGKKILDTYKIPVLKGVHVKNLGGLDAAIKSLTSHVKVVKAQVLAGGRGKAGGVNLTFSNQETKAIAERMYGSTLVTPQTGPEGVVVHQLYIEEGCQIEKEYYMSLLVDRTLGCISLIVSSAGGVSIEEVAEATPEKIVKLAIYPDYHLKDYELKQVAQALDLSGQVAQSFIKIIKNLYRLFWEKDCQMIEINPLVLSKENNWIALDCKMDFDDNALFRHPDIAGLRDFSAQDEKEIKASEHHMAYVALEGDIACMVNGAGLAMATIDGISNAGGQPANFLDVGGSASKEQIVKAFEIILSDPKVKGIFINIFGGIMHCDTIAKGIISAVEDLDMNLPLVVRLEGTNKEEGQAILNHANTNVTVASDLEDGAEKIVRICGGQNEYLG